jgi:hypothetical protein
MTGPLRTVAVVDVSEFSGGSPMYQHSLENINDTRNGILLHAALHNPFGASKVAFLRVSYLIQLSFHVI